MQGDRALRILGLVTRGVGLTLVCLGCVASGARRVAGASPLEGLTVYVESLGAKPGAADLKKQLTEELRSVSGIHVVNNESKADAVIRGEGEIWIRHYYSLNPRAGNGPGHGRPVLGGFLSVELQSRSDGILWSYLATPHVGAEDVEQDLAKQVAKGLKIAIAKGSGAKP
ncbi:MAG: hypothetical protein WBW33_32470 [Bryobacteraceae bacterium]